MTPEQSGRIWNGLEARLAGVETFVHDAPPWTPPGEADSEILRPVSATSGVRAGRAIGRPSRTSSTLIGLAAAAVIAVLFASALLRPLFSGPGTTPSPSPSASPTPSPTPTEADTGDFGTPLPTYTTFANPTSGWSVAYDSAWSVIDDPFAGGPHGVTQFGAWNAGQMYVLVGAPGAGAPKPCSACGTFTSRTVDELADEVLEFLRLDKLNPPGVSDLDRTVAAESLDGEDARFGSQTYPPDAHEFPTRDLVFVAIHAGRQYVIVLVPNIPEGGELTWFPKFAHDFRFSTP